MSEKILRGFRQLRNRVRSQKFLHEIASLHPRDPTLYKETKLGQETHIILPEGGVTSLIENFQHPLVETLGVDHSTKTIESVEIQLREGIKVNPTNLKKILKNAGYNAKKVKIKGRAEPETHTAFDIFHPSFPKKIGRILFNYRLHDEDIPPAVFVYREGFVDKLVELLFPIGRITHFTSA